MRKGVGEEIVAGEIPVSPPPTSLCMNTMDTSDTTH